MARDYKQHATLHGYFPTNPDHNRGGKLAEGPLGAMIPKALDYIDQGYRGVCIMADGGRMDAAAIREEAEKPEFQRFKVESTKPRQ